MPTKYTPLTQADLDLIGMLGHFSAPAWTGPALPRPEGSEGLEEVIDTVNKLLARAQYLIQAKDGLSILYTLQGVTATAERFMLGTQEQVQQAADLRSVLFAIQKFLSVCFATPGSENHIEIVFKDLRADVDARSLTPEVAPLIKDIGQDVRQDIGDAASAALAGIAQQVAAPESGLAEAFADLKSLRVDLEADVMAPERAVAAFVGGRSITTVTTSVTTVSTTSTPASSQDAALQATPDYSAFTLEDPSQFSMAWTTFEDAFRKGYPHIAEYSSAITDPSEATRQFWLTLRGSALPYNLFVLHKLDAASAMTFKNNFGSSWIPRYDDLLNENKLYGIDMTVFAGLTPQQDTNGTVRFTPSTMALLEMDDRKNLNPIAAYVADPTNINNAQIYTSAAPSWIYGLLAVKTSLTVYGIWLGHVYSLHIVTAAMQMATLNTLPATNIIYQLLAPQSHYTIPFDLLLMLGWSNLSPPTSISDAGKFLTICNKFSATHNFFATDPANMLAGMNLDPADFTDPAIDDKPWNLYPNVQMVLKIWQMTADYVGAVVNAGYATDAAVAADTDLANWIGAATGQGNVAGLPRMDSKAALKSVVTSVLYRITFHGMGRLRSVGSPEPSFAPNFPPCLQSTNIPDPQSPLPTSQLLKTYLPNTGTLGKLVGFYDIFAYNAPYVPAVPNKGPEDELFYDQAVHPTANQALIDFRNQIQEIIRTLQPDWVQIGQWPRNIEL